MKSGRIQRNWLAVQTNLAQINSLSALPIRLQEREFWRTAINDSKLDNVGKTMSSVPPHTISTVCTFQQSRSCSAEYVFKLLDLEAYQNKTYFSTTVTKIIDWHANVDWSFFWQDAGKSSKYKYSKPKIFNCHFGKFLPKNRLVWEHYLATPTEAEGVKCFFLFFSW